MEKKRGDVDALSKCVWGWRYYEPREDDVTLQLENSINLIANCSERRGKSIESYLLLLWLIVCVVKKGGDVAELSCVWGWRYHKPHGSNVILLEKI